jgi:ABC-2 type transport system ATP-binding protein
MAATVFAERIERKPMVAELPPAIAARGLRKRYGARGEHVDALLGVDLVVHPGEIVGVLGPNGAGKTTLIEILEGLRQPDAGSAEILGVPLGDPQRLKEQRHRMGISLQHSVLPPALTVQELLVFQRTLFDSPIETAALIEEVALTEKRDTRIGQLSGGQQQRVAVAMALAGDPEIMFLDEPTSQLDPQARRAVWEALERQRERRNAAIIITTHQMEEAQRLCRRVVILDRGRIIESGTPGELIQRHCSQRIIEFVAPAASDLQFLTDDWTSEALPGNTRRIRVQTNDAHELVAELIQRQRNGRLLAQDIRIDQQTLEDVFLKLTGRRIRSA